MNTSRETTFRFKQFALSNQHSAMKVGTDGVLLGAWATLPAGCDSCAKVLDVGCGTGVIGLMVAQRYPLVSVHCIDINADAVAECGENIRQSPFADRVAVSCADFINLDTSSRYDLIVSNPPFFNESLHSPLADRAAARHDDSLPLPDLLRQGKNLLSPDGRMALIYPSTRDDEVLLEAALAGLQLDRRCHVITRPSKSPRRTLWQLSLNAPGHYVDDWLIIADDDGIFTQEYVTLLRDFYLNF